MSKFKFLVPAISGVLMFSTAQAADPVGKAANVEGEVYVLRGNATHTMADGDNVLKDDRIIAYNGTTRIKAFGCEADVPEGATMVVNASMCDDDAVVYGFEDVTTPDGSPFTPVSANASSLTTGAVIPPAVVAAPAISGATVAGGAALVGVPVAVAAGSGGGDGGDEIPGEGIVEPVSP